MKFVAGVLFLMEFAQGSGLISELLFRNVCSLYSLKCASKWAGYVLNAERKDIWKCLGSMD